MSFRFTHGLHVRQCSRVYDHVCAVYTILVVSVWNEDPQLSHNVIQ